MPTEDETFERLLRPSFEQLHNLLKSSNMGNPAEMEQIILANNWDPQTFYYQFDQYWKLNEGRRRDLS